MSPYYRFESGIGLEQIRRSGWLKRTQHPWASYPPYTVILLFECDNLQYIIEQYADGIADLHSLEEGEIQYILKISRLPQKTEPDKSAEWWPESIAHFVDIPRNNLSLIGHRIIKTSPSGQVMSSTFEIYPKEKPIGKD